MRKFLALPPYEPAICLFLSFFRFLSFTLGVALIFIVPKEEAGDRQILLVTALLGVYTVLKVLSHFRLWQRGQMEYVLLVGDVAVCLAVIFLTGGADSPFLLYSLLPIATTALFFEQKVAVAVASLSSFNLLLAHLGLPRVNPRFPSILEDNYLTLVAVYVFFCFLVATITYQTNLNVYRRIQSESILLERRRLRREVHDGVAQVLGYLGTRISLIKKSLPPSAEKLQAQLEEIDRVAKESCADIRQAIDSLAVEAESVSLVSSLSAYTEEFGHKLGIKTEFAAPRQLPKIHPVVQLQLYRIAQEALNNVRKHAAATQVWVRIEKIPQGIELAVKDNGRGFLPGVKKGAGLGIVAERANSIGGSLTVTSSPEQGTEVRVKVGGR